ncbi:hypothetical protein U4I94_22755, partial [Stenotrophomonas maltophilia]|nr:hypothetical protein [Stenotrophomonas maltophilia]
HDPRSLVGALTKVLSHSDLVQYLASTELTHELTIALRGSVRLSEMRSAVAELRSSLGRGEAAEHVYQLWCEKHCWAFGNAAPPSAKLQNLSCVQPASGKGTPVS